MFKNAVNIDRFWYYVNVIIIIIIIIIFIIAAHEHGSINKHSYRNVHKTFINIYVCVIYTPMTI